MLLLILGFTLAPITHKTEYTEAIGTASDTTITMTTGHTSAALDIEVDNSNGTFASSTLADTAQFGVTTNNVSGYTLSISGPDNTGKLVDSNNADTTSNYISTLDLPSGTNSISASEFTNNTNYTNKWGYKPSKYNSNANSNFFPAPTTTATTLDKTTAANGTTTVPNATNDYSIELGAKLDYTVNTGSYSKTFILTAVGNPVSYNITFSDNTGDNTVANIPAKSSSTDGITATSVTLPSGTANIPTRTGYTFKSWCLGTVNTTGNVGTTCTGTEYNAGAEFPINQTTTNVVTLYATWTPNKYTCTKQYRLQKADGTWNNYTKDSTESVDFGTTCSYSKSVADYKNSSNGTNNAQASTSGTMNSTNGIILSLSFYRNTYALTVNRNTTYVASASATTAAVHNDNYYRWGQSVSIAATLADGGAWPATIWSQTAGTTSSFADATSASTTFTMPKSAATIYADGEKSGPSITDLTYLQDFAALDSSQKATVLGTMTANTNYTLKDKRDEQSYTIARLTGTVANSNYSQVWMTKNLNLAGGTALNSTTTDMPDNYTLPTANGFGANNTLPASSKSGFSSETTAYVYNSRRTTCSSPGCYSYYSWTAATLGSGLSESGDGTDVTTASICPKGWRLPTSGNRTSGNAKSWKKGDFYKLATAYGANLESNYYQSSGIFYDNAGPSTTVPKFLLASRYYYGSFVGGGGYWSSSSSSSTSAYYLGLYSNSVDSADGSSRGDGLSVRCVLKDYVQELQNGTLTMQEFAKMPASVKSEVVANMAASQAYTLIDNRDYEQYKVAKLADGNVWLLDNLRLDLTRVSLATLQGNTNADDTTLSYLKTSTSSAPSPYTKYAVSSSWTSSSQDYYDRPMINTSYKDATTTGYGDGSGKIGVYYNYCAATAGSYCYAKGSGTGNASQDICPKGWSLPTGNTSTTASFNALCKAYNNNTACSSYSQSMTATATTSLQYNLSTPLSGGFYSGSPDGQGSRGLFWSSTWLDGIIMYLLNVNSSTVFPRDYNLRTYGFSVRCLLQ